MTTQAMAAHAAPAGHSRLTINRVGLWLFILSESFIFAALLSSRFYLTGLEVPEGVNQPLGLLITAVLLLSSLTAYRAETAMAAGDRTTFVRNTAATIVLGLVFVVGVGFEWHEAAAHFPPHTEFGTVFFTLTGMHAFHVITGLLILGIVLAGGLRGAYGKGDSWGVEAGVKYWHFVDVVWVFIYPTLYLAS